MSARIRLRGKFYHLDFHNRGHRIRRTLKVTDRRKAEIVRTELEHSQIGGPWNVSLALATTVDRAIERFASEYQALHHAESTRVHATGTFEALARFLRKRYSRESTMDTIRQTDLEAFQRELTGTVTVRDRLMSRPAVNRALRELSTLFNWAVDHGICRINPCSRIKRLKETKRIVEPASLKELKLLSKELQPVLADALRLITYTGMRLGECLHLRKEDISLETKTLFVRARPEYGIKDREERAIQLTRPALTVCRARVRAAGRSAILFPSDEGTILGGRNALRSLHDACAKLKMRRLNWQLLRRTFTTIQGKVLKPWELKAVLGHSDIRTTDKHYLQVLSRDCRLKAISI